MSTLAPALRKFTLTAHVTSSVGFLGAIAAFLALAIAGLSSKEGHIVRGAYVAMELTAWSVIVPLAIASLVTGVVQALGTEWGLFRHWWVAVKLLISIVATGILLVYMMYRQTLGELAALAAASDEVTGLRSPSPVLHATAGLVLLLTATTLSVYKPRGMTPFGARNLERVSSTSTPRWVKMLGITALCVALLAVLLMTGVGSGHGPGQHFGQ